MAMLPPGGQGGQEVETLENEADLAAAQLGALGIAHGGQVRCRQPSTLPREARARPADHIKQ